jgi:hypothetical protein
MKKSYRLKLNEKTIKYLKKIKREYKVKISVGDIQEFDIKSFNIPEAAGYYFVCDDKEHIYVANRQGFKYSHDVIVLHEIGHLLMNRHRYLKYSNQEESFANGFALAKAQELGIYVHPEMVLEMCKYSDNYYNSNRKKVKRK